MPRFLKRLLAATCIGVVVVFGAAVFTLWSLLNASLPRTSGQVTLSALRAPVKVSRDSLGIPVIEGQSYSDVAGALGFVHAQDRFFQMDIMRRSAAGELSELIGSATLAQDKRARARRFRAVAADTLRLLPEQHRRWLESYADGVNAGIHDLSARPPEYLALRAFPVDWRPEDSLLAMFTMFENLTASDRNERMIDAMRASLPLELVDFLTPDTTRFDAPVLGPSGDPVGPRPIPGPHIFNTRTGPPAPTDASASRTREFSEPLPIGSNNWAVAASRTIDLRAILANDMHLGLMAPNVWYRAQLQWTESDSGGVIRNRRVVGVTLPGVPAIVVGSNGEIAWGFTNAGIDTQDYIIVETLPNDPSRYSTPEGPELFRHVFEDIKIRAGETERITLRTTRWGVVSDVAADGRPLVLKWTALDPEKVNINLIELSTIGDVDEALRSASKWYGPPQNVLIADKAGRIGWVVSGWLPNRSGFDGRIPVSWATPGVGWHGSLTNSHRPSALDPADGVLFTANQRTIPIDQARRLGFGWAPGERARRIAASLRSRTDWDESGMLALQLDTVSQVMEFYRDIVLRAVSVDESDPTLKRARELIESWNGRADSDQPGFRLLVLLRRELGTLVTYALVQPCVTADNRFRYGWFQWDEPLMRILEERPDHLRPIGFDDWDAVIHDALHEAARTRVGRDPPQIDAPWGLQNRAHIVHYISLAVPALGPVLNMPRDPLPGHHTAIRVQGPGFGASQRMVVSPGAEDRAMLHMPCGQSGHPFSPHYADSHPDWVAGTPVPLLAGPPVSAFSLVPADGE